MLRGLKPEHRETVNGAALVLTRHQLDVGNVFPCFPWVAMRKRQAGCLPTHLSSESIEQGARNVGCSVRSPAGALATRRSAGRAGTFPALSVPANRPGT